MGCPNKRFYFTVSKYSYGTCIVGKLFIRSVEKGVLERHRGKGVNNLHYLWVLISTYSTKRVWRQ